LVTGGAGYVGSHTCKALAAAGFVPITYDNLTQGHEWAVQWGPLERGNILDSQRLRDVMRRHSPAAVFHFAALSEVGKSVTEPAEYYHNNVIGTIMLLDAMKEEKVDNIVFSSTCAVYGPCADVSISEGHGGEPLSPYGASKKAVERVLQDYGSAYGLRSVALRYFNAAGADAEGLIGEDHKPETHLVPLILDVAAGIRPNITVFGADHPTSDGTCIRDYTHVSDLADGHVAALRLLSGGRCPPAVNLGTGKGASVAEVVEAARRVTGATIRVVQGPRRAGDPASLVADTTLAQRALGWSPKYLSIDDIVRTAWSWHQIKQRR